MKKNNTNGNLIIALSRALQTLHKNSEQLFRRHGITMAQFAVLEALLHKGDLTINELIQAVLSSSGNMTVVIRNLEKLDYVSRMSNPKDRRSYTIRLTDSGKELIEKLFEQHMNLVEQVVHPLTIQDKETIIHILKKLR